MKDVLSEEELVARLNRIMEEELNRPQEEQDMSLLEECSLFLAELLPQQKEMHRKTQLGIIRRMFSASE